MRIKAAVIQSAPIFFNKEKTIQKLESLVEKYAKKGCELIVFPESYIPGYPRGFSFGAKVGYRTEAGRKLYAEYYKNSFDLSGPELNRMEKLAKKNNTYLVVGVTEKNNVNGSLFCAMIYISPINGFLGVHRKIKPTGTERIVWSEAGGDTLVSFNTKIGKIGGLICWENYMPLARMSMYQKGVEIYIAPTADARERWVSSMQHIALEGRCFVLGCNQFFTKKMYPKKYQQILKEEPEEMSRGGSVIVSPMGEILAGPLWEKEGALVVDLDLNEIIKSKLDFDPVGHYARNDIFELKINGQPEMAQE
ncbi:MAG: carbon-nitrogen hydrolase family protein [Bacteroidota bacterium]